MAILAAGQPFPDFELPDQGGLVHTKAGLLGQRYAVFFYPKDDTPGCTVEACEFSSGIATAPAARVFGVSPDPVASHAKFAAKFDLGFPLLADTDHALAEACGVWGEKSMYGRTYMGVARTTFLVGPGGVVERVWEGVTPKGHAAEVIAALG